MLLRIEDDVLFGDRQTAALLGRDGSLDWLCLLRFDSPAYFAAPLGTLVIPDCVESLFFEVDGPAEADGPLDRGLVVG